ncbi:transketolase, partial [Acetobacter senegalensis]
LGLGRLVYVYDDNHISIDGPTELALGDVGAGRFAAYGWHVVEVGEKANDLDALEQALRQAQAEEEAPSLVILRSHIGWPSPKYTDTAHA